MGLIVSAIKSVWKFPSRSNRYSPQLQNFTTHTTSRKSYKTAKGNYYSFLNDNETIYPSSRGVAKIFPSRKSSTFLEMAKLDEYPMPMSILALERDGISSPDSQEILNQWLSGKEEFRLSEELYISTHKMMAFFEEASETIKTEAFNLRTVNLNHVDGKEYYFDVTPDSKELFAAIDEKQLSHFTLKSPTSGRQLDGKIKRRESGKIFVELFLSTDGRCGHEHYDVHYKVNRMNYQLQQNALNFIQNHRLFSILINNPSYHSQHNLYHPDDLHFLINRTDLNNEQMQAVKCIMGGKYNPVPYLLYGPPGTGKTKTVVAAIEEIVRTTKKSILVCAQSNAACNEIAERLAKVLTTTQMLRMFSTSYNLTDINSTIEPFCNLFDGELKYPSLECLYEYRVLICTLSTAGCLVRARNKSIYFNPQHFGYVFIDECASAHETMALIPIAGLCTSVGRVHANVVLIGDPKQLDAVTKSDWSTKLGFKISWFEQLFNSAMYKRHAVTGKFNRTYITQLIQNYRSHEAILKIPNELFYDNLLIAIAKPDLIQLEVEGLLTKKFPIIFKSVHGYCRRDEDTSSFNMEEVKSVMVFIGELLKQDKCQLSQGDIGVVSPYRRQCDIIRKSCERIGCKNITIGSAEAFQGQERKVMIISTVRSHVRNLGDFVKNPQRFNVMITRAKSLLIVVGNPHLLSQDENWSSFIRYCFKNRCLVQDDKFFRPKKITNGSRDDFM